MKVVEPIYFDSLPQKVGNYSITLLAEESNEQGIFEQRVIHVDCPLRPNEDFVFMDGQFWCVEKVEEH